MATGNVTITIQAASDSVMTEDNSSGAALAEGDCRKAYGLPHTFLASPKMRDTGGDTLDEYRLIMNDRSSMASGLLTQGGAGARWDEISPVSPIMHGDPTYNASAAASFTGATVGGYGANETSITGLTGVAGSGGYTIDRRPTTTAFQLKCDTFVHDIADMAAITPLPGVDWSQNKLGDAGTPEQLDNFSFSVGLRQESMNLSGVMIDRGLVTAANPRRQVLLNIARTQYLKVRNAEPPPTAKEIKEAQKEGKEVVHGKKTSWGGRFAGALNPRSYPCLTIFNQDLDDANAGADHNPGDGTAWRPTKGDVEPDNAYKIYRGMIQSLSFSMEPGRPDFWRWQLQFKIIANEKRGLGELAEAAQPAGADGEDAG